jgi:hypothetical protein
MRPAAWFPAVLFAAANPAAAQSMETMLDTATLSALLAYDFCPGLMNGEASLANNAALMELGFPATPEAVGGTGFPGFVRLDQVRSDGFVSIGGVSGLVCEVNVAGRPAAEALVQLRSGVFFLGLDFEADPANSGLRGDVKVEALKTPRSDEYQGQLQVLFMETTWGEGTPSVIFQIIYKEQ